MELLPKMLNEIQDSNKMRRCGAFKRMSSWLPTHPLSSLPEEMFKLIRICLKSFEDESERCREEAIKIINLLLLPYHDANILDWILPAIVTRIGVEPVAETSEEIRLRLLVLASRCISQFPHDIGPRNYIDYFQVLLENCFCDAFPELKKKACHVTCQLCNVEPQQMKLIAPSLIQTLKKSCLIHKHSTIRAEGVLTFAALLKCGRAVRNILNDPDDEPKDRSIVSVLFILSNDHSESVRLAVIECLIIILLDMDGRLEYHRHYLPHLLLLSTDSFSAVRTHAIETLHKCGDLYKMDNEDNRIDLEHRHVSLKDVEWYADDEYPDMSTLSCLSSKNLTNNNSTNTITNTTITNTNTITNRNTIMSSNCEHEETNVNENTQVRVTQYAILQQRPSLGQRYVVAESVRGFIDNILHDINSIDWVILYSNNNRRVVALRILWNAIFHCEKSVVQFTHKILSSLYKAIRDEDSEVRTEALLCVEIMGKFLEPDHYLPFLIARPAVDHTIITLHAAHHSTEQSEDGVTSTSTTPTSSNNNNNNKYEDNKKMMQSPIVILSDSSETRNRESSNTGETVNVNENVETSNMTEQSKRSNNNDHDDVIKEEDDQDETIVQKGHKKTVILTSFNLEQIKESNSLLPSSSSSSSSPLTVTSNKNIQERNIATNDNNDDNNCSIDQVKEEKEISKRIYSDNNSTNSSNNNIKLPTLFSTAGFTTKCAILTALPLFLRGSSAKLTNAQALKVTQALTSKELVECGNEELLECLLHALIATVHVLASRGFIATRSKPLPEFVLFDVRQRTLDSIILYSALCMMQESNSSTIQQGARNLIETLSSYVSNAIDTVNITYTNNVNNTQRPNNVYSIYNLHVKRLLHRYGAVMPVCAFAELVLHTNANCLPSTQLKEIFVCKLSNVNFQLRVVDELRYFQVLEQLLWSSHEIFCTHNDDMSSRDDIEVLLHTVILPHCNFHAGNAAHLFRKVAVNCLCALLYHSNECTTKESFCKNTTSSNQFENEECNKESTKYIVNNNNNNKRNESCVNLHKLNEEFIHKIVIAWCSASDSDDGEVRLACMSVLHKICGLQMSLGDASEVVQSVMLRLDDGSESVQLRTVNNLLRFVTFSLPLSSLLSLPVLNEINSQIVPLVRKLLIYIDDEDAPIELRTALCHCVEKLGQLSPNVVVDLVRNAERKHRDARHCQQIVNTIISKCN